MPPTSKPISAAISRLIRATISGWPATSVLFTSTAPGMRRIQGHQLVADPLQLSHVVAADVEIDRRLVRHALHELGIGDANLGEGKRRELAADCHLDLGKATRTRLLARQLHLHRRGPHLALETDGAEHLADFGDLSDNLLDAG